MAVVITKGSLTQNSLTSEGGGGHIKKFTFEEMNTIGIHHAHKVRWTLKMEEKWPSYVHLF